MTEIGDVIPTASSEAPDGTEPRPARSWIARLMMLEADGDRFVAVRPSANGERLFGGLVAAQALAGALSTVDVVQRPQSLHACFVRPGRPDTDVVYTVERTRDGRSFATRQVTATQGGEVILEMLATFHVAEPGADWHPPAAEGPTLGDSPDVLSASAISTRFEVRVPDAGPYGFTGPPYWLRSREVIEEDPGLRACALTYLSDMGLLAAARPPGLEVRPGAFAAASLDHSVWFHRAFDPNAWHRYSATQLNSSHSCGLALGALHDADGTLIATTAQEGLWRV